MKTQRAYYLPTTVLEATEKMNRSEITRRALQNVLNDPQVIAEVLIARIKSGKKVEEMKRTNITIEPELLEDTNGLADRAGLSTEQVIRLAMEAYLSKKLE